MRLKVALLSAGILVLAAGCTPPGQRALHVRVEQNGQVVAEGMYSVPDSFDRRAAWERLSEASLEAVGQVTPDANDPNLAVLTGDLTVTLEHASRPYAAADATWLKLIADSDAPGHWKIDAAEVGRVGRLVQ
jgi:hypothetical protein